MTNLVFTFDIELLTSKLLISKTTHLTCKKGRNTCCILTSIFLHFGKNTKQYNFQTEMTDSSVFSAIIAVSDCGKLASETFS